MQGFIDALIHKTAMPVGGEDGINAIVLADAAYTSLKENRLIKIE